MDVRTRQARDTKTQARWEARRAAKIAALAADPVEQARLAAEGERDARADYDRGHEPDNAWTRQDAYARAWRDETTRIMQARLAAVAS